MIAFITDFKNAFKFFYVHLNYNFTFKHFWSHLIKFNLLYSNNHTVKYFIVVFLDEFWEDFFLNYQHKLYFAF